MYVKEQIKIGLKIALHAARIRPMYFGVNLFDDIRRKLPHQEFNLLFDVGANQGQTVKTFLTKYPNARVHCFEPNADCCGTLRRLGSNVTVHQMALGDATGEVGFDRTSGFSGMFFVTDDLSGERVPIDTVDNFAAQNQIKHIDFLKIDAEGYDLKVIVGARNLLANFDVDLLLAEVSMRSDNTYQVSLFDVQAEMERSGYRLFGLYEQTHEWSTGTPCLKNANALFVSPKVMSANQIIAVGTRS